MGKDIKVFSNEEFGNIRTLEINGYTWFVGNDVARALGYENPKNAVQRHVDIEDKTYAPTKSCWLSELKGAALINESGLYSLILGSKMLNARKFKHWVTSEILPSVHRYGAYISESKMKEIIEDADKANMLLRALNDANHKTAMLETRNAALEYKGEYYDKVLQSSESLTAMTLIAKDYGMSAVKMNILLNAFKVQYRSQNGVWVLYAKYQNLGYTKTKTYVIPDKSGDRTVVVMYWTEKGREFLYRLLKSHGIFPKSKSDSASNDVQDDDE